MFEEIVSLVVCIAMVVLSIAHLVSYFRQVKKDTDISNKAQMVKVFFELLLAGLGLATFYPVVIGFLHFLFYIVVLHASSSTAANNCSLDPYYILITIPTNVLLSILLSVYILIRNGRIFSRQ